MEGIVSGRQAIPNIILALFKAPGRRKRWFLVENSHREIQQYQTSSWPCWRSHGGWRWLLVDGIGRGRPAITNKILALLMALWRKRFLVDEIVRGSSAIPIMTLALLKTPSVESANTIKVLYLCLLFYQWPLASRWGQGIWMKFLDSKLTSPQKPFWLHGGAEILKIMTLIQNLPHPCWFLPYRL